MQKMVLSPKDLGVVLRDLRKKQGITQAVLGKKVGLDQKKVSLMENGNPNVRLDSLFRLLSALGYGVAVVPKRVAPGTCKDDW